MTFEEFVEKMNKISLEYKYESVGEGRIVPISYNVNGRSVLGLELHRSIDKIERDDALAKMLCYDIRK